MAGPAKYPNISVEVHELDGVRVLTVAGDLNTNTVRVVHEHLDEVFAADTSAIIADFSGVTILAATGLRALEALQRRAAASSTVFSVVVADPFADLLRFLELPGGLRVHSTLAAALAPDEPASAC
ncbi:STAS domain-containing protein [Amycolatopsis sp. NPDC004378]